MQPRLIGLLAGLLVLAIVGAALVPLPEEAADERAGKAPAEAQLGDLFENDEPIQVILEAGDRDPSRGETPVEAVPGDEHAIVTVRTAEPGQVELRGLGRLEPAGPGAPAVFDLFTDRSGEFPVLFTPTEGPRREVATLVVGRAGQAAAPVPRR